MGLSWLLFWLILLGFPSDPPITVSKCWAYLLPSVLLDSLFHTDLNQVLLGCFEWALLTPVESCSFLTSLIRLAPSVQVGFCVLQILLISHTGNDEIVEM